MPKSRYSNTDIIDSNHYGTFQVPTFAKGYRGLELLQGIPFEEYVWRRGDRFDKLAGIKFNEETYWWIICLCNDIAYPFGIEPGTIINIPLEVNDVLRKLF